MRQTRGTGVIPRRCSTFGTAQGRDAIHRIYGSVLGIGADATVADRRDALDRAIADRRIDPADEPFAADMLLVPQSSQSRYEAMDNAARTQGKLRAIDSAVERASCAPDARAADRGRALVLALGNGLRARTRGERRSGCPASWC